MLSIVSGFAGSGHMSDELGIGQTDMAAWLLPVNGTPFSGVRAPAIAYNATHQTIWGRNTHRYGLAALKVNSQSHRILNTYTT